MSSSSRSMRASMASARSLIFSTRRVSTWSSPFMSFTSPRRSLGDRTAGEEHTFGRRSPPYIEGVTEKAGRLPESGFLTVLRKSETETNYLRRHGPVRPQPWLGDEQRARSDSSPLRGRPRRAGIASSWSRRPRTRGRLYGAHRRSDVGTDRRRARHQPPGGPTAVREGAAQTTTSLGQPSPSLSWRRQDKPMPTMHRWRLLAGAAIVLGSLGVAGCSDGQSADTHPDTTPAAVEAEPASGSEAHDPLAMRPGPTARRNGAT